MKADPNIAWSEKGELKYKGETVRGSNVVDLVNDVLRKRKYFNPQGWETFGEALREANVPQDLIGHEDRWKYITQTKRTPRSRKRQQSPSPIRPYSPKHQETEGKKSRTGSTFKTEVETTKGAVVNMESTYYNVVAPASYGGLSKFKPKDYTKKEVREWLQSQDTYTLHKPTRRRLHRRQVVVYGIDHQWQADLVDLAKLSSYNKGFKYLLTCIDVLSRYAWVVPLKDKTGKTLKDAFQVIFKSGRRPIRLQTDKGTEFTNRVFQKFLKEHDVHFFTTYNEETKASIVERFNRTLKTKMWKYFTHRETLTYVEVLSEMVASYNHTVHRTIVIPPAEVTWANQTTVSKRLYGRKGPKKSCKFSPGDRVRLSKAKRTFKKGYLPNWTEELFTVVKCIETRPPVYLVKDDHGEILEGTFYAEEIQKVIKQDDVYKIQTF